MVRMSPKSTAKLSWSGGALSYIKRGANQTTKWVFLREEIIRRVAFSEGGFHVRKLKAFGPLHLQSSPAVEPKH